MHNDGGVTAFLNELFDKLANYTDIRNKVCIRRAETIHGRQKWYADSVTGYLESVCQFRTRLRDMPSAADKNNLWEQDADCELRSGN